MMVTDPASNSVFDDSEVLASIVALQQQVAMVSLNRDDVMRLIVTATQRLTKADSGIVEIADGDEIVYAAASGKAEPFVGYRLHVGSSLSGLAMRRGEAQMCVDAETDKRVDAEACRKIGVRSMILVPLRHEGRIAGVLKVASRQPDFFSAAQMQVLHLMGGLLGSALGRADEADARHDAIRILETKEQEIEALNHALERKVEERTRQLTDYAQRLEMALSAAHMTTWDWNFASNMVIRSSNDPAVAGLPLLQAVPRQIDHVHPDDVARVQEATARSRELGEDFVCEYRVVHQEKTRWVMSQGRVVRDEQERPVRLIGITMDITEQHAAEGKMRALEAEQRTIEVREQAARQASEMKSEFLANVSHELRNPLNGILGMAELLAGTALTSEQTEFVGHLRRRSETLLRLVSDILDLSKAEAGKMELEMVDFTVRDILNDATSGPALLCRQKGLLLKTGISPTVPERLRGDPTRLTQLLVNLIANAVKFTNAGSVSVQMWGESTDNGGFALTVEVQDTGIGIAEKSQKSIFKPFAQADNSITRRFGGTGLGLSICQHLVTLMGGEIRLHSVPGQGSTFTFTVPLRAASKENTETALVAPPTDVGRHLRVLVAEDDNVNQVIARHMLEKMGHKVTVVDTGQAAVDACQSNEYDLVLMDGQMPEMSGLDATRKIRDLGERGRALPIIAMTGDAMVEDEQKFLAAGMNAYVSKPITIRSLREVIARAIVAS